MATFARSNAAPLTIEVAPYAQHENAVRLTWIAKGQRREREIVQSYRPDAVVLAGHGHVDPDSLTVPSDAPSPKGVTVERVRYMSADPRWRSDFDGKLVVYLESSGAKVAADYRGHKIEPRVSSY